MHKLGSITEIATSLEAEIRFVHDEEIQRVLTDSRSLEQVSGTLFFAFKTKSGDGHRYLQELYDKGVRSFVVEKPIELEEGRLSEANILQVPSSLGAIQKLASDYRAKLSMPIVGITGSFGKTIVKEYIYSLLEEDEYIARSPKSYNSQIGVPLSVLGLDAEASLGLVEAGISEPREMEALQRIIRPEIGVFTGIGQVHMEHFASAEELLEEKLRLFAHSTYLVTDLDNELVRQSLSHKLAEVRVVGYSRIDTSALLFVASETTLSDSTALYLSYRGSSFQVVLPFADRANVENALLALTFALSYRPDLWDKLQERVQRLRPIEMRLEVKESHSGNTIINDAYSCDLDSLRIALDFQRRRSLSSHTEAVLILSEMASYHLQERELYKQIAEMLQHFDLQELIGVGHAFARHADLFAHTKAQFFEDAQSLIASERLKSFRHSCILIKGARRYTLEQVERELTRLEHQTILEVNLTNLRHNLSYYRSLLPPMCRTICMIKADAYGLGSIEIARTLEAARADYLAVALADEGRLLREAGIQTPIMVMNPEARSVETLFRYRLEPEVYSLALLETITHEAERQRQDAFPIHIKIDSGMHRLGFQPEEIPTLVHQLKANQRLVVRSVFSHLAAADEEEKDEFSRLQGQRLEEIHRELTAQLNYPIAKHLLNTAGIERLGGMAWDMVRLGIGLYGVSPSQHEAIRPVAQLSTILLQSKWIDKGERIGYGCQGVARERMRIGIIPIGYADGFFRRLGQGCYSVEVGGALCPTIGRVCMDTTMIDLTPAPDAKEGDRVWIFGSPLRPVQTMAEQAETISYEVFTSLSPRIQRLYYEE